MTKKYSAIAAWFLCAVALFYAMRVLGGRQMGAFDDNIVIDTAWRMFIGQRPYTDFYLPLSPEFFLGAGWAFRLWGVNWSALVLLSAVFAVVTFALQSIALSHFLPRRYAIAISLVCQMLAMMVTSYWWYNSNASITACLLFSAALALATNPVSKTPAIIFCVALMMMSVMKVNVAAVSIAVVVTALMTMRELRNRLILWMACSALAVLLLLMLSGLNPIEVVEAYLKMAGSRGKPSVANFLLGKPNEAFVSLPLIGACLAAFSVLGAQLCRSPPENRPREYRQVVFIASSGLLVGMLFIFMSTEQTLISALPLMLLSLCSLVLWASERRLLAIEVPSGLVLGMLLCAGATATGLALFDRLPFDTLLGDVKFRAPHNALLILWSSLVAMSVASFAAGMAGVRLQSTLSPGRWPAVLLVLLAAGATAASYVAERRLRVRGNGVELFYSENPPVAVGRPFFRDFAVSPGLKAVVERIEAVLHDYESQGYDTSHVFFGVRLEFAYAAFGIPSPTQTPVWWDPEAAYPPADEPAIVERFVAHRFPMCVLYGKEPQFTFLPKGVVDELTSQYRRVSYPEITLFLRNPRS